MSGICGLFNLDSLPVREDELVAMTSLLAGRGPDGRTHWYDGPSGLGHTLLVTTPALKLECQPWLHAGSGCAITADVRLDNRQALLTRLAPERQRDQVGDAELLVLAYLNWGENAVDHLLGDFAFAISDPRHQRIFCARDHSGLRPLYYHHQPRKLFAFASDARAILVLPQIPYSVNQGRIADFLVQELEWIDYTSTFYDDVNRLPPGHAMTVTPERLVITEYWKPQPNAVTVPRDYVSGFLDVFSTAVESRLRTKRTGAMLSGGLDSGAIVAVAQEIITKKGGSRLQSFSAMQRPDADCAESRAIRIAIAEATVQPTLVYADELNDRHDELMRDIEEPYDGETMILKAIYDTARNQGMRVLLDGGAGDVVLNESTFLIRLLKQGRLRQGVAETIASARNRGYPFAGWSLLRNAASAWLPESLKQSLRPAIYKRKITGYLKNSLISAEFASSIDIRDRFDRMRQTFPVDWTPDATTERCLAIRPNATAGIERYARLAASVGLEASDPFLDKRVLDYCSGLPEEAIFRNGWPKYVLREALSGKYPSELLWSPRKPHLGWQFTDAVSRNALRRGELELDQLQTELGVYVDRQRLADAWHRYTAGDDVAEVHTAYVLAMWLREAANRPNAQQAN